ncbi:reverse transcriptase domain-containing protein [Tanacetum coccineum]
MEDEFKPSVKPQRRVNPNIKDVAKKEVIKLLDAGLIFPISDSPWVSPVHVVPKKGGMTVVKNEKDELIPQRTVTGWRVCIDYRKLNNATWKYHFPLPFIDQMLERLAGHEYYCFLDGFSGYFQIPIAPEDQEKTIFTYPYGTFAYKRMPFELCNAPATFQRCMTAIFHELINENIEVFMDDFSIFGSSLDHCLKNLEKMLKRCEKTNLVLNWEKCHFMVKEGIVLGHKVSGSGIEVDKAKIEAISKLPYPTNVKSIRSFLGHAGFYRRYIKDFSQIACPMTQLLVKDAPFNFFEEFIQAFDKLKRELTQAPIMIKPDWSLPFEIMCDASDYAVGAVLGQRIAKHFKPIHYASKIMNEAQENYTTTKKELLVVVFVLTNSVNTWSYPRPSFSRITLPYEFDIEIRDKKCAENLAADHLSRLENPDLGKLTKAEIKDLFPVERLMAISDKNNEPWKHWSYKLDEALWAFRTAFKTPLGTTPFRIIYGKAFHLLVELEHKAYWVIKNCNLDLTKARENHFLQINELDEMRLDAYETSISYKERTKRWHDKRIKGPTNYEKGDKVLLFNSRLRLFPRKLKSRWYRPFSVCKDMKNDAIELYDKDGNGFIVNKQHVKPYHKIVSDTNRYDDITLDDEGEVT